MSLQLLVVAGPDANRSFILHEGDGLMLGRSQQAYYQLNDPHFSRNHCQIVRQGVWMFPGQDSKAFSARRF